MRGPSGQAVLAQLIKAYEEEATLYAGLESAAAEQCELLLAGRDPRRLGALVERQRVLAEQIGQIESGIAPLREYWEQIRGTGLSAPVRQLAGNLDSLLEGLAARIHRIVEIERGNSQLLVAEMSLNRT